MAAKAADIVGQGIRRRGVAMAAERVGGQQRYERRNILPAPSRTSTSGNSVATLGARSGWPGFELAAFP